VDDLPFGGAFDLVTCRIAAHHFADIGRFLRESARALRPGGLLAVVDNVVPCSRLRGKRADRQRQAGAYGPAAGCAANALTASARREPTSTPSRSCATLATSAA